MQWHSLRASKVSTACPVKSKTRRQFKHTKVNVTHQTLDHLVATVDFRLQKLALVQVTGIYSFYNLHRCMDLSVSC